MTVIESRAAKAPTMRTDWHVRTLLAYQLLPGLARLGLFVPSAWLLRDSGVTPMITLFASILLAEVPVSWYLMLRGVRSEGLRLSVGALFPWRSSAGLLRLSVVGTGLAALGMVFVFGAASVAGPAIRGTLFDWFPPWLIVDSGPGALVGSGRAGLLTLWILSGVVGVGIGGVTQELFHRGFLLPRARRLGWVSVPVNALAFAVMHFEAPWGWPFFFLAALLWGSAVYRWKAIQFGLVGHVGVLAIGWLMMTAMVFGLLPPPPGFGD